jgi:hypothetical protein
MKDLKRQIQAETKQCLETRILTSLYLAAGRRPEVKFGTGHRETSFHIVEPRVNHSTDSMERITMQKTLGLRGESGQGKTAAAL